MSTVFTGTVFHSLKKTLNKVINDPSYGESQAILGDIMDVSSTDENYVDDLAMAGFGLAAERAEGEEIAKGTMREDYLTRYNVRNFGLAGIVTQEAMEDCKYDQCIDMARRLPRAMWKTIDIDWTFIFVRAVDTNYVGGDGVPLASASHPLANGGTESNLMATPMTPSRAALQIARNQIKKMKGHDGIVQGYNPKKIHCPTEQSQTWLGIVKSQYAPEPGQFNEINVVYKWGLEVVENQYWSNTTTNWALITDVDNGLRFIFRKRPKSKDWVENSQSLFYYATEARWTRGWSDWRSVLFVNA
jgi:hypothetical protein